MLWLCLGLILFLGVHATRVVAEGARTRYIQSHGEKAYKGLYTVVSLVGLGLILWGYGQARSQPVLLWSPPVAMKHVAAVLTLVAFVLLAAAYVPGNHLKAKLGHPMVLGVKTWALAHLLANGLLAQVLVFSSFLIWAVLSFRAARRRDLAAGVRHPAGRAGATVATVLLGVAAWAVFALYVHAWWLGVAPFGR